MMMTLILMIEKTKMKLSRKPLEIMCKKITAIFIDDKGKTIKKNCQPVINQSARPNIFKYDER